MRKAAINSASGKRRQGSRYSQARRLLPVSDPGWEWAVVFKGKSPAAILSSLVTQL
jgi:hypothetical protein